MRIPTIEDVAAVMGPNTEEQGSRLLLETIAKAAIPLFRPGTKVRLRNRPEDTGVVLGMGSRPGDVRVRWDQPDAITYISARQLEVAR